MAVRGQLQREGLVISVIAKEFIDLTSSMALVANGADIGVRVSPPFHAVVVRRAVPLSTPLGFSFRRAAVKLGLGLLAVGCIGE